MASTFTLSVAINWPWSLDTQDGGLGVDFIAFRLQHLTRVISCVCVLYSNTVQ